MISPPLPPASVPTPVPPPTPYKGLKYNNLKVQSEPLVDAFIFQSPPNNAVVDTTATAQGLFPSLSRDYTSSQVKTFDFYYFYFGCKVPSAGQGNGGPATGCTVQVKGYKQSYTKPSVCDIVTV